MMLFPEAFPQEVASLPATAIAAEVNRRLAGAARLVVTAPPGAGKSTILPLTILSSLPDPGGRILMLEPRRIAARQIAERMAALLGEPVGRTVGYRIRFESRVSAETRIEVLTEGILTRRLIDDPGLEGVSVVIFDEFHERSLASDQALALTREAQQVLRPDLKIVLMSATIDTQELCAALDAPLVEGEGRMYPVEIRHTREEADERNVAELVARTIGRAHREHEGDILAFLPGEGEIRRCVQLLGEALAPTHICPLYGLLSSAEQRAAIAPSRPGERKVVLATPIAETSLTIEGVRIVVDGGFCRHPVFDPQNALSRLETVRISLDMAAQRTGRAGRCAPGVCYRLWSPATEQRLAPTRTPEILEADLASVVLDAAAWGEAHVERLAWLTPPPPVHVAGAEQLLRLLGATDAEGRITPHGRALSALPCHPRIAQMLLRAESPAEKALAADLAALLEERDPLPDATADIGLRVAALRQSRRSRQGGRWSRILRGAEQYRAYLRVPPDDSDASGAGALLAAAYPERVAKARPDGPGCFQLASGELAAVDPSDALCAYEWLSVASLHVRRDGVGTIFLAAPVEAESLRDLSRSRDRIAWDSREGAVVARRETRIGSLLLAARPLSDNDLTLDAPAGGRQSVRDAMTRAICEAARREGASMLDFAAEPVAGLQRRVAAVAAWHPELALPDLSTEAVLAQAPSWLPPYVGRATTLADLKKIDLEKALWGLLSYDQQQSVEQIAPSHITVPTGSRIRLEYRTGAKAPVLRVRLQECFGLLDTPRVDGGRRPILMELLSPGYKSVQLTSDLRSFWTSTYFEVRKELRRRYPRHAWPDDPLTAPAVRGVARRKEPQ